MLLLNQLRFGVAKSIYLQRYEIAYFQVLQLLQRAKFAKAKKERRRRELVGSNVYRMELTRSASHSYKNGKALYCSISLGKNILY